MEGAAEGVKLLPRIEFLPTELRAVWQSQEVRYHVYQSFCGEGFLNVSPSVVKNEQRAFRAP